MPAVPPVPWTKGDYFGVGIMVLFCWSLWALFFLMPVRRLIRTRAWTPSTCELISSRVASHHDSDGTMFGIDVKYRWSHGGASFTGGDYDLYGWSSSGAAEDWAEIVRALPPGAQVACFVNPRHPREAVRGYRRSRVSDRP